MKISVVMPIYNERDTLREILRRVREVDIEKEIICVDDHSSDGTWNILEEEKNKGETVILRHTKNMGKGAAVRTGLKYVSGDIVIIQDADLEYDPQDYHVLIEPILAGTAEVVYGSRFKGQPKDMGLWHNLGNNFLTAVTNFLYKADLTDMETCYKVFTSDIAKQLQLKSHRWGFDPEITAQILKMGYQIHEVPISYAGRDPSEGKKISWRDGFVILFTLLRYRFSGQ